MDHLVFAVPDLAGGIDLVERTTGVRARFGGRHPGRGTHNALLSLGKRQYLELIAIDPEQSDLQGLMFPELKELSEPRLIAWAVAVESLADAARRASAGQIKSIGPLEGARAQADGTVLTWKTLRLVGAALDGLPFFIEWGDRSAHPSQTSPAGCTLASFAIEHTNVADLRRTLDCLGVATAVRPGPRLRLQARLDTPRGEVELS
jgi:Glyoxalase-like domain